MPKTNYTYTDLVSLLPANSKYAGEYEVLELLALDINDSQDHPKMIGKSLREQVLIIDPSFMEVK